MTATLRPELGVLPTRIARLPIDDRGYPVPWFVAWQDGKPEFRAMDGEKFVLAVREKRCWVCGDPLGAHVTFVAGPMCGLNRTSGEPPSHRECAQWSARHCPFLSRPQMVRREDETLNNATLVAESAGIALARNPGVALLWTTKSYRIFSDGHGKPLIRMGPAEVLEWYAEGRAATREEVAASVAGGVPALMDVARAQEAHEGPGAVKELLQQLSAYVRLYPASEGTAHVDGV